MYDITKLTTSISTTTAETKTDTKTDTHLDNHSNSHVEVDTEKKDKTISPSVFIIPILVIIILTIISIFFIYNFLPLEEKKAGCIAVLSIGITAAAFVPQLLINHIKKSIATDNVLAVFLIMAAVGVILRLPALRQALGYARGKNKGIYLNLLLCSVSLIPLLAHIIWQWQGAIYDDSKAIIAKHILLVAAPLSTIITILLIFWLFSVKPITK